MDIFSYVFSTACIILVSSPLTATYLNEIGYRKTVHTVDIFHNGQEDFPDTVQMILSSPKTRLLLNYTKTLSQLNIPIHFFNNKLGHYDTLDIGETQESMIYEDRVHETLLTFHCHNIDPHSKKPCILQSVFAILYLDGHQHFIRSEKLDIKSRRWITKKNQKKNYILPHHVYKTIGYQNHKCSLKNSNALNLMPLQNYAHRTKRDTLSTHKTYTIEVLALVDPKKWVENKIYDEGLKEMQTYFAHVFDGINNLYKHIQDKDISISVKLMGIALVPNITDKIYLKDEKGNVYVDGAETLKILAEERAKHFSDFDHIVMFSAHKISGDASSTVGLANVGAMCGTKSVSIVVESGGFMEILIAAHEIGHSLNSKHDGQENSCLESDSYIMSAIVAKEQSISQKLNSFLFSKCSIKVIKEFLQNTQNKCLEIPGKPFRVEPPVVSKPTGQVYSLQEQCKVFTDSAGVCPKVYSQNLSTVCLNLLCLKNATSCSSQYAAHKTSCGNKKWCVFGTCEYDAAAPEIDESCPLGDNKKLQFTVKFSGNLKSITTSNCSHLIQLVPNFCETSSEKRQCCRTCNLNKEMTTNSAAMNLIINWCSFISIASFYLF